MYVPQRVEECLKPETTGPYTTGASHSHLHICTQTTEKKKQTQRDSGEMETVAASYTLLHAQCVALIGTILDKAYVCSMCAVAITQCTLPRLDADERGSYVVNKQFLKDVIA